MKTLLLALACCMLIGNATAQVIEYDIPTEINLVPGRLAVTFADSVSEANAFSLLAEHGYKTEGNAHFAPVTVLAVLADSLSAEQRAFLEADDAVQSISPRTITLPAGFDEASTPRHLLRVEFESTTTEAEATGLLVQINGLRIQKVTSLPKELTIIVAEGEEEVATETLSALPQVRYVSYLMADVEE